MSTEYDYGLLGSCGEDVFISRNVEIRRPHLVSIGSHVAIDTGFYCTTRTEIGDYIHIAPYVSVIGGAEGYFGMGHFSTIAAGSRIICGSDEHLGYGLVGPTIPPEYRDRVIIAPVIFEKFVNVATNVVILPGVILGEGCVVGACSLVVKSTEPWTIYYGIPARPVKARPKEKSFWDGPIHPSVLSYGSTRRMMWVISKCYYDQYGVRSVNLAIPNMYGPYDSTNPNKTHALNALVIKFVRAVKYNLQEVEVWGTGKPVREWLYVKDFAHLVRIVIENKHTSLELVNLAQNRGYPVNELVSIISDKAKYQGKVVYNTRFLDGAPKKVMDDGQFRQHFPDFQFTPIETGIAETIQYYSSIL